MLLDMAKRRKVVRIPTPGEILAIRTRLGLTQTQAAERIGVTQRSWLNYERGHRKPSPSISVLIRLLSEEKI